MTDYTVEFTSEWEVTAKSGVEALREARHLLSEMIHEGMVPPHTIGLTPGGHTQLTLDLSA